MKDECASGRRHALVLLAALAALAGCSQAQQTDPAQLFGKWQSSRLATPLYLGPNGEWEVRTAEDRVLQYGVWHLEGRKMVWTVKLGGRVEHDVNTLLKITASQFELRERDGSVTRFERLD